MLSARAAVRSLKKYHPPLSGRTGLRLDFNENTQGASPRVLARLRELTLEELARYPEREPVERQVAEFLGVSPAEVLLTNGVDEGIHLLCQTFLQEGDEAVLVVPTFAMYELLAGSAGAKVIAVPAARNFEFPTDGVIAEITERTRLVAVANPNNPTGAVATRERLLRVAEAAPQAAVLVDEAYFEFYGESMLRDVRDVANLFVARTFSKAYGLAGLRIGVLAGCEQQMQMVRKVASPYNANGVALSCLPAAMEDQQYVSSYVAEVVKGRERLQRALEGLGIRYWPSRGNFVLAAFGEHARQVVTALGRRGILVRDRSSDPGCAGCVRMTVGNEKQMDELLVALEGTVREIGMGEKVGP